MVPALFHARRLICPYDPGMTVTLRPVVETWLDQQLRPCSGSVWFQLDGPIEYEPGLGLVVPSPVEVPLAADGGMRYEAPTTDIGPGAIYKVSPKIFDGDGIPLWCGEKQMLRPFHILVPPGAGDLEMPPPTFASTGYVAVQGPPGVGVKILEPGEVIPPYQGVKMLVVVPNP